MATFNSVVDMLSFGLIGKLRKKLLIHADLDRVETYTADSYIRKDHTQTPPPREQKVEGFQTAYTPKRTSSSLEYLCPKRSKSLPASRYKQLKSASNPRRSNSQKTATKSAPVHSSLMNREKSWESATSKKMGFLPLFSKRKSMNNECADLGDAVKTDSNSSLRILEPSSCTQILPDTEDVPNKSTDLFPKRPVTKKLRGSNYITDSPRYQHLRDHSRHSYNNSPSTASIRSSNSSVTDLNPSFKLVLDDHIMPGVPTPSSSAKLY